MIGWTTRGAGALLAVLLAAGAAPAAEPVQDLNAIIRSLAPIHRPGQQLRQSIDLDIRFEVASDKLSPAAAAQLDELGRALLSDALKGATVEIAGHTDASGRADYNKQLSHKRAEAVKAYLVERHGIDPARLQTVGWGFEKLKNAAEPTAAENRRVEVTNLTPAAPAAASPPDPQSNRKDGIKLW